MSSNNNEIIKKYKNTYGDVDVNTINWNNLYNYQIPMLANALVFGLLSQNAKIHFAKYDKHRFITSDQPIFNSAINYNQELVLFYPIDTQTAIIISNEFDKDEMVMLTDDEYLKYSNKIIEHAESFIMGKEKCDIDFTWPTKK